MHRISSKAPFCSGASRSIRPLRGVRNSTSLGWKFERREMLPEAPHFSLSRWIAFWMLVIVTRYTRLYHSMYGLYSKVGPAAHAESEAGLPA